MSKPRPFSKLKKIIGSLFDEKLKMEFCCIAYPIRGQWANNSIPRFYLKMGKEIIWDFPIDFDLAKSPFYYWAGNNNIVELVREYIDTPPDQLLNKEFKLETNEFYSEIPGTRKKEQIIINYKLTDLFKAADRRLGKEKIKNWALTLSNPAVDRIIQARFDKAD